MERMILRRFRDDLIALAESGFPMESSAGEMALLLPPREDPIGPVQVIRIETGEWRKKPYRILHCFDPENPFYTRVDGSKEFRIVMAHEYGKEFELSYDDANLAGYTVKPVASIRIPTIYDLCAYFRSLGPGIHTELTHYGLRIWFEHGEDPVEIAFPANLERSVKVVEQAAQVAQREKARKAEGARELAERDARLDLDSAIPTLGPEKEPVQDPVQDPELPAVRGYGRKKGKADVTSD